MNRERYTGLMDTVAVLGRDYRPRVIDSAVQRALAASGALVIEGARASGKTMTALHAAASYVFIDDADVQRLLEVAPRSLLEGEAPRLLDEWQVAPELWNLVRRAVDSAVEPGRFILTGSCVPPDDVTRHTGGRPVPAAASADYVVVGEARRTDGRSESLGFVRRGPA